MTNDLFQVDVTLNQEALNEWLAYRKEINKPLKPMSIERVIKKLIRLSEGNLDKQMEIVEQSIENGWTGLFAVKKTALEVAKETKQSFQSLHENVKF